MEQRSRNEWTFRKGGDVRARGAEPDDASAPGRLGRAWSASGGWRSVGRRSRATGCGRGCNCGWTRRFVLVSRFRETVKSVDEVSEVVTQTQGRGQKSLRRKNDKVSLTAPISGPLPLASSSSLSISASSSSSSTGSSSPIPKQVSEEEFGRMLAMAVRSKDDSADAFLTKYKSRFKDLNREQLSRLRQEWSRHHGSSSSGTGGGGGGVAPARDPFKDIAATCAEEVHRDNTTIPNTLVTYWLDTMQGKHDDAFFKRHPLTARSKGGGMKVEAGWDYKAALGMW